MENEKPALKVLDGGRAQPVPRIALSLVIYERKRLDIPLDAIVSISAGATQSFSDGSRTFTYDMPHVLIALTPAMQRRLHAFTKDTIGDIMEVHVGERCISRARLHEPLGTLPSFQLNVGDFAEAQATAETLRTGWRPVKAVEPERD